MEQYKQRDEHWAEDAKEGQVEAQKLEAEVTLVERHASRYDLGEALLQIAVVLASITLLTRRQTYFVAGAVLGPAWDPYCCLRPVGALNCAEGGASLKSARRL